MLDLVPALGERVTFGEPRIVVERDDVLGALFVPKVVGVRVAGADRLDDRDRLRIELRFAAPDIDGVLGREIERRLMDGLVDGRPMERLPRERSDEIRPLLVLGRDEILGPLLRDRLLLDIRLEIELRLGLLRLIDGRDGADREIALRLVVGAGRDAGRLDRLPLGALRLSVLASTAEPISKATTMAKTTRTALGLSFSLTTNIVNLLSPAVSS